MAATLAAASAASHGQAQAAGLLESLSREELWRRAKASHDLIVAGYAVYEVDRTLLSDVPSHHLQPEQLEPYRITFAFKEDRRRITRAALSASFGPRTNDYSAAFDGEMSYRLRSGAGRVREGKDPETEMFEEYFNSLLNVPLSDYALATLDNGRYYPHCIRPGDRSPYRLREQQEQVDGAWCYAVEWAHNDKLWIDPATGYHFRKRVQWDVMEGDVFPGRTNELEDFFEAIPGYWVPRRATYVQYAPGDSPRAFWGRPWLQVDITLKEIRLNDQVREDDLDFPIPAGSPILMPDGTTRRAAGDRSGLLAELAGEARGRLPWVRRPWFVALNVVAALAVLALVLRHWWRGRRAARGPASGRLGA